MTQTVPPVPLAVNPGLNPQLSEELAVEAPDLEVQTPPELAVVLEVVVMLALQVLVHRPLAALEHKAALLVKRLVVAVQAAAFLPGIQRRLAALEVFTLPPPVGQALEP